MANSAAGLGQLLGERRASGSMPLAARPGMDAADPLDHAGRPSEPVSAPRPRWDAPAQPAELAPAYVFLASEAASYIVGATLPVTGGRPFL